MNPKYVCNERIINGKRNNIENHLIKICSPNIYAYFGTYYVKIGQ